MLQRRILRIKAFKVLFSFAENPELSLKEALATFDRSCQATRDEYLFMLSLIPAVTSHASRLIEAARGKFNPTEEDLNPNLRFVNNRVSRILCEDPDFGRITEKRKISWENCDAFISALYNTVSTRGYFAEYMASGEESLMADAHLWQEIFRNELEDNEDLAAILEEKSIWWPDELGYVLGVCIRALSQIASTGRWELPPLFQSEILASEGKKADSDSDFVHRLISATMGRYEEYSKLIASNVSKWDLDRLYTTDTVLISMGLAEARTFPEIPVKVTINEYVEISKYYSTPRSRGFVNGLLDKLIKAEGLL